MAAKIKVDQIETVDGSGTIALQNQLSGMTGVSMPTGSVLQVVQDVHSTQLSVTSTSWVETDLAVTITPSSSSSKILLNYMVSTYIGGSDKHIASTIYRVIGSGGTTDLAAGNDWGMGSVYADGANVMSNSNGQWLDSPNTTSAITYTYRVKVSGSTGYAFMNSKKCTLTAMEVQG